MAGTITKLAGPLALTTTYTTDIYVPGSALKYSVVRQIHVANKTGSPETFRLYLGATGANAAGTELYYDVAVPANDYVDLYLSLKMTSTTFLVGGASAATALSITIMGDEHVVPA